jgi:hypothetical protein
METVTMETRAEVEDVNHIKVVRAIEEDERRRRKEETASHSGGD